jgi:hypothetical protein
MSKSIFAVIPLTVIMLCGFCPRAKAQRAVVDVGAIAQLI